MATWNRTALLRLAPGILITTIVLGGWLLLEQPDKGEADLQPNASVSEARPDSDLYEIALPASTRDIADAQRLQLCVVREDGTPVSDARLVLFRELDVLESGTTDAKGRAVFEPREGEASIVVRAAGHALHTAELPLSAGERTLRLPEGHAFGGRVLVDGAAPLAPPPLRLYCAFNRSTLDRLPLDVRRELAPEYQEREPITILCASDASFVVRGLPAGERGRIDWDPPWIIDVEPSPSDFSGSSGSWDFYEQGKTAKQFTTPQMLLSDGLVVKLARPINVRLELVRADGASIHESRNWIELGGGKHRTRLNGRDRFFEGQWIRGSSRALQVQLFADGFDGALLSRDFRLPEDQSGVWDLGAIELPAPRSVWVEVLDVEGKLLEDCAAQGESDYFGLHCDGRFDSARKRLFVELGEQAVGFWVTAPEHDAQWVQIPALGNEIQVVLQRCCQLLVSVEGEGVAGANLELTLHGPAPLVRDMRAPDADAAPTARLDRRRLMLSGDSLRTWSISHLTPGVSMRIEIRDQNSRPASYLLHGDALASREVAPLLPGEQRRLQLELHSTPRTLLVRVLDPSMRPARLGYVVASEGSFTSPSELPTNSNGEVVLHSLLGELLTLRAWAMNYPTQVLRDVPASAGEVVIVLEQPRRVEIEVVDAQDAATDAETTVSVDVGYGTKPFVRHIQGRRWAVERLPPGIVTIEVDCAGRRIRQLHDTSQPFARVVLGEPGSLRASCSIEAAGPPRVWSVALAPVGAASATSRAMPRHSSQAGELRFESRTKSTRSSQSGELIFELHGLALGAYDVWLESAYPEPALAWSREGAVQRVLLDADQPNAEVELQH